nr:ORF-3 [Cloning vector pVEcLa4]
MIYFLWLSNQSLSKNKKIPTKSGAVTAISKEFIPSPPFQLAKGHSNLSIISR